jgi:hypothetical protein
MAVSAEPSAERDLVRCVAEELTHVCETAQTQTKMTQTYLSYRRDPTTSFVWSNCFPPYQTQPDQSPNRHNRWHTAHRTIVRLNSFILNTIVHVTFSVPLSIFYICNIQHINNHMHVNFSGNKAGFWNSRNLLL